MNQKVEYTKQTKEQYLRNLKRAFRRNKWIDVKLARLVKMEKKADVPVLHSLP